MQPKRDHKSFLAESEFVPDLPLEPPDAVFDVRSIPGGGYIPRNRPDLYEKCALMLFERWDKRRGIQIQLPFEANIRPAMMYLAEWIYTNPELQSGVTEKSLVDKTTQYLCPRRFEDSDEAEQAAREFIEFCRGRAWVFSDVGTTPRGERIYQFTHRTFLEYFAAKHLARVHHTPEALATVLFPRIAKSEWDVVAQIAFQIANNHVEGAGDKLLENLVDRAEKDVEATAFAMLSFAARCLEFMVPSPRTVRKIATACLHLCTTIALREYDSRQADDPSDRSKFWWNRRSPSAILMPFVRTGKENLATLMDACGNYISEGLANPIEVRAVLGLEIANAGFDDELEPELSRVDEFLSEWRRMRDAILDTHWDRIADLARRHWFPCFTGLKNGKISVQEAIEWHGFTRLFRPFVSNAERLVWRPYANILSSYFFREYFEKRTPFDLGNKSLAYIGEFALALPGPLITMQQGDGIESEASRFFRYISNIGESGRATLPPLTSDALFGALVVLLIALETATGSERPIANVPAEILDGENEFLALIRFIVSARVEGTTPELLSDLFQRYGLSAAQRQFIKGWVKGEIHLVEGRGVGKIHLVE